MFEYLKKQIWLARRGVELESAHLNRGWAKGYAQGVINTLNKAFETARADKFISENELKLLKEDLEKLYRIGGIEK